jgi:hypothetical protein
MAKLQLTYRDIGMKCNENIDQPIDEEVVDLCKSLNTLKGITTIESCCGHDLDSYRIWFLADALENLPPVVYFFDA